MKKTLIIISLMSLAITSCGCIKITAKAADGGIYKSIDGGETWEQKVYVGKEKNRTITISGVNVETMAINPQDTQNIFIGTRENGLYATSDGGETWKSVLIKQGLVENIAINPGDGQVVYAALGNKVVKTLDGGENWRQIYLETSPKQTVTAMAIDGINPQAIYIGISDGRILKSFNAGQSWTVIFTPKRRDKISQILIHPANPQIIYAAAATTGIYKSIDEGQTWQEVSAGLKNYSGANYFKYGIIVPNQLDSVIIITRYGILKTEDGGTTWQDIKLLTSPGTMEIYSLAVNPQDENEIHYGTATAIYKTTDGGANWIARSLPAPRAASRLLIDPADPNTIYMGTRKVR